MQTTSWIRSSLGHSVLWASTHFSFLQQQFCSKTARKRRDIAISMRRAERRASRVMLPLLVFQIIMDFRGRNYVICRDLAALHDLLALSPVRFTNSRSFPVWVCFLSVCFPWALAGRKQRIVTREAWCPSGRDPWLINRQAPPNFTLAAGQQKASKKKSVR